MMVVVEEDFYVFVRVDLVEVFSLVVVVDNSLFQVNYFYFLGGLGVEIVDLVVVVAD
jgi:hypothetical protein